MCVLILIMCNDINVCNINIINIINEIIILM